MLSPNISPFLHWNLAGMLSKLWFGDPVLIVWFIHERVCNFTLINQRKIQVSSINNKCEWFTRPDALQQVYITFSHSVSNKPWKARNVRQQLCVWPKQSEFPEAWNSSSWLMWPSLSHANSSTVFSRNCVFLSFYGCYKMLLWNSLCKVYLDHGFCSLLLSPLSLSPYCRPREEQKTHYKNDGFAMHRTWPWETIPPTITRVLQ